MEGEEFNLNRKENIGLDYNKRKWKRYRRKDKDKDTDTDGINDERLETYNKDIEIIKDIDKEAEIHNKDIMKDWDVKRLRTGKIYNVKSKIKDLISPIRVFSASFRKEIIKKIPYDYTERSILKKSITPERYPFAVNYQRFDGEQWIYASRSKEKDKRSENRRSSKHKSSFCSSMPGTLKIKFNNESTGRSVNFTGIEIFFYEND